jgi:hypothetical protein
MQDYLTDVGIIHIKGIVFSVLPEKFPESTEKFPDFDKLAIPLSILVRENALRYCLWVARHGNSHVEPGKGAPSACPVPNAGKFLPAGSKECMTIQPVTLAVGAADK